MRFAVLVLVASRVAHAEPPPDSPFVALASTGIGTANIDDIPTDPSYVDYGEPTVVQTLLVELGYRVERRLMLGVHAGVVSKTTFIDGWSDFMGTDETHYGIRTVQYGIAAQVAVHDRVWLAPWLGVQDSFVRAECNVRDPSYPRSADLACTPDPGAWDYHWDHLLAAGITVGFDVYRQNGHRVSIIAAAQRSSVKPIPGTPSEGTYTTLWLGVAYRFWR